MQHRIGALPFPGSVEHRREVARRRIDDLQHFGGRSLLFQRLALLRDQPCILHRDHRLGGEVFQQRDLLIREWPDLRSIRGDKAEQTPSLRSGTNRMVLTSVCAINARVIGRTDQTGR